MKKQHFWLILGAMVISAGVGASLGIPAQVNNSDRSRTTSSKPTPTPSPTPSAKPPRADEETEVVKVETELVNLNVRVVDRFNRPINDIKQNDFKIYEDGVLQTIDFFSRSEVPTNYSLVVDNSGSLRFQIEKVIEAGKILVNTNRPDDETSIIRFVSRDKITVEQPFTAKKDDLIDTLDNLYIEGGQTAIIDAVYLAVDNVDQYEKSNSKDDRKRRAIILVSDGEDRDSYYNEKQLFDRLRESDVQIYVVGFVKDLSADKGFISKSPQGKAKAFLERLASETGGKAYFPESTSELAGIASDIGKEMRTQYSIGYIPTNDRKDNTYRNIKVQIDDGPAGQKRIPITKAGRIAAPDTPSGKAKTD
jgi:Ca-activated chloride channel family protein